jgi:hypothetical protein
MTQCSVKAGVKDGCVKKLHQLMHFQGRFEPVPPKDLTPEELQEALEFHMFLEEKQDQTVKCPVVA